MKGAALLVGSLIEHEVRYIFGLPGDTSLDFYEALYDAQGEIRHVLATDERNAAYMADAYARITNKPGVCEGPSGGGATYIIPGLYEANGAH
jgi:acetolactate synthase-1/2/3 large subunit